MKKREVKMSSKDDDRNKCRIPIEFLINFKNNESEAQSFDEFCQNLSEGGVCIDTINLYPPGSEIEIEFYLPHKAEKFEIKGKVIWSNESEGKMGIQFVGLDNKQKENLQRAISYYNNILSNNKYVGVKND